MEEHTLIAFKLNGQDLPLIHGAPVRLIVPGWAGSLSTKWLTRIWIRDKEHDGPGMGGFSYRVPKKPIVPGSKGDDKDMAILESMPVRSVITFPADGARLPAGVTMADYAHRGAYALIVTALLAGLFVLVTLRPGSPGAASPAVRRLVTLWIVQNVLLVASSALRTLDYVDAYSMTVLRLSALIWMALVATGLMLILWRLLGERSSAWLVNANALAAAVVLTGCTLVDLRATAAAWNVDTAIRRHTPLADLDLCYLDTLGPSAILPLARLEQATRDPAARDASFQRGLKWMMTFQCRDGGWAAFDKDCTKGLLEHVPFADHNAMLDPECADITARILELLGYENFSVQHRQVKDALDYIRAQQEADGSWYGRWGVNYVYGTWQVLRGMRALNIDMREEWLQKGRR